ncbi:type I inositol polyphosphate 5-phosphatase 10 isoform X1 [Syzygium oleosum]|uniref:type I inositol polyphosphate 5-phosphatase 10 isoform X1 n=1 Tax=Syzygium oleosum TaxID=219896 RepID=UPI0011D2257D|nr:type I inositol polyphosphate 5-phosphatase 10 isoform X1 [Syzygium oleosum]XP_056168889.1 type I inositol polyphosphate 5-phosphatase 10 isoform X1 [Syzygium oleosum]XP_056168890.1 type I inositol polyphosphate 5-phosphatase 10 isoform X1 [Syzygium oleosum]XP_056168891.1 type I inositol polyphosphate 5-phosphatase 10 isoform X1 [Syzygium oleosum]
MNQERIKKKSFSKKVMGMKNWIGTKLKMNLGDCPDQQQGSVLESSCLGGIGRMPLDRNVQTFRVYVATWNVGGKSPRGSLNLDEILQVHDPSDIYVLGFQEIVPLNAGNVLVIEDTEPAVKWLTLINQSLNKPHNAAYRGLKASPAITSSLFFPKPSLKKISKVFRTESRRRLKACNCPSDLERKNSKDLCFRCQQPNINEDDISSEEEDDGSNGFEITEIAAASVGNQMKYGLIAIKQMVGIFVTVWIRRELVQHVSHLRISCISRGIMGCLGNKGCISVSMSFHQTSFCFICSHLASGEKEGDELRRNSDVIEILKNTQFPKRCRIPNSRIPTKILEHDRVIWLGDLNYRISLSYPQTIGLMDRNAWDALFDKDQLKIEREAGRVFKGWKEGKISFAPTYKFSYNSDAYAGENVKSKDKRRTPAWCDRILWHGNGIRQISYFRRESQFSDHRPVCSAFLVDVVVTETGTRRVPFGPNMKVGAEELLPPISR